MCSSDLEFASLSRFAVELVSTDERHCHRFRYGINGSIASRLISFRERDYADLVDMASRIGRDIMETSERRARSGKFQKGFFGGNNYSKAGSEKTVSKKPYDRNRVGKSDNKQNAGSRSTNRDTFGERRCYKCDAVGDIARECGK